MERMEKGISRHVSAIGAMNMFGEVRILSVMDN